MYTCGYVCVCIYIYMYMYHTDMCIHIIYICVYTYIYICAHTPNLPTNIAPC